MGMKASATQRVGLYELKQHKLWFHKEYLQPLVQRRQDKIQLFTGSQPKKCRESKSLSLLTDQEKISENRK